jgi:hypothetical protein
VFLDFYRYDHSHECVSISFYRSWQFETTSSHAPAMDMDRALELVRSSTITWRWTWGVQNRQAFIFSPADLNFWIAVPPKPGYRPASHGPYVGFNLSHELSATGRRPDPDVFPADSRHLIGGSDN